MRAGGIGKEVLSFVRKNVCKMTKYDSKYSGKTIWFCGFNARNLAGC